MFHIIKVEFELSGSRCNYSTSVTVSKQVKYYLSRCALMKLDFCLKYSFATVHLITN